MTAESRQFSKMQRAGRPWDAWFAAHLVQPLAGTWVRPNHLTTVRLAVGLAAAAAFTRGTYGWSNLAALLLIGSNFLDHADGELARMTGRSSRIGHHYDLASDAAVTILLFIAIGLGVGNLSGTGLALPIAPAVLGAVAGVAVAIIFFLRMRIEEMAGKAASRQAELGGFQTEDVLYLLPLVTLFHGVAPFLVASAFGAPLFAVWVVIDYRNYQRRRRVAVSSPTSDTGLA